MKNHIVDFLNNIPPILSGVALSIFIAVLRVIYDREETTPVRIGLEACICGGLTLSAVAAVRALGLNENWALFIGGAIGYLGSNRVRDIALKIIGRKIDENN